MANRLALRRLSAELHRSSCYYRFIGQQQPISGLSKTTKRNAFQRQLLTSPSRKPRFYSTSTNHPQSKLLDQHRRDVDVITDSIRTFHARKEKYRIFHGSTNTTRPRASNQNVVDISTLNRVIHVDRDAQTVLVEPNVPMDRLVEATLPYGLVPPVVMEFPGITVGGGYAGTCGESSSFKHGFFNTTINFVEMVLADGTLVRCSETERPDLFHGAAGALGTFGVTTLVELRLIKAEKYVETTFHPIASSPDTPNSAPESTFSTAVSHLNTMSKDPALDYLDAIVFSPHSAAVISGRMTSDPSPSLALNRYSRPSDPWFYMHAQSLASFSPSPVTTLIPLAEYLFRFDRGGFWVGRAAFTYFSFPFTSFTRRFLDDFLHTRMLYSALHASGQSNKYLVQDFALPWSTASTLLADVHADVGIYPLWLCPLKTGKQVTFHPHQRGGEDQPESMLNVGVYGWPPRDKGFADVNRGLNDSLARREGTKWLYAQTFYTEDELWDVYPREWYEALREKYGAAGLPSVADKVAWKGEVEAEKEAGWPWAGVKGLRAAIRSKTYLEARKAAWREWS